MPVVHFARFRSFVYVNAVPHVAVVQSPIYVGPHPQESRRPRDRANYPFYGRSRSSRRSGRHHGRRSAPLLRQFTFPEEPLRRWVSNLPPHGYWWARNCWAPPCPVPGHERGTRRTSPRYRYVTSGSVIHGQFTFLLSVRYPFCALKLQPHDRSGHQGNRGRVLGLRERHARWR